VLADANLLRLDAMDIVSGFLLVFYFGLPRDRMGRSHSLSMFSFVAVKSGS
jgi:hypothetical protein